MDSSRSAMRLARKPGRYWVRGSVRSSAWTLTLGMILMALTHQADAEAQCEAADHGMRANGSDNIAALTRTLAECAGKTIHIASGTYNFSPSGFAVGINVPAGTTLVGDGSQGSQPTILQVTSSGNFQSLLWIRNVSNVAIRGIRFEGTGYESGCTRRLYYGHAIFIQSDADQSASVEHVEVSNDAFHNFNGESWVAINAADGSPGIGLNSSITIRNNVFESDANLRGGCAASGIMVDLAAMISIHGADKSAQGMVKNVAVTSNILNAGYVKEGVAVWSGTKHISVEGNSILDTGFRLPLPPRTELGRYAVLIYNSAHEQPGVHPDAPGQHPDTIRIADNTITNPVSCGIYVASGRNLEITGNHISGQSDRWDGTLLKGAIALNHAESVLSLRDNVLVGNYIGIASVGSQINMGTNRIEAPPGGVPTKIR
jgi:Protein of unknown function (DUF1565)